MSILNITPDSFSDGGLLATASDAVAAGIAAADLGAALIDVGGESTRPRGATYGEGASRISENEEARRVLPVIEGLHRARPDVAISVDTRSEDVAESAFAAGAVALNLVTGLDATPRMLAIVVEHRAALILNHCRGTPQTTFAVSRFEDVVAEVARDLAAARRNAIAAGVKEDLVLLDPGLGFGKSGKESFALLASLDALAEEGVPLVVGASRKAFLDLAGDTRPVDRLPESLAAVAIAARAAVSRPVLVRVHDTGATLRFLGVLAAAEAGIAAPLT
jgi:dihydropteroate synthase